MLSSSKTTNRFLANYVSSVYRLAPWIITIILLITGGAFFYTAETLTVDTDSENILSPNLPFRQSDKRYIQLFPQYENTLVVVIEGEIPEYALNGAKRLAHKLEQNQTLFKSVYLPETNDFFNRNGLMYLDLPHLEEIADNLAQAQPFLGRLAQDPTLSSLLEMLNDIIKAKQSGETTLTLQPIFSPISKAIESVLNGRPQPLSWQELIDRDSTSSIRKRQLLIVQPQMDFSRILPAGSAIEAIRTLAKELQLDSAHGIKVQITGDVALSHEELESALKGNGIAGILALAMISAILFIGLRSISLIVAILLGLITGLILTTGFATLGVGHLNVISTAFAVLYIGLGTEYDIQFCMRYHQLIRNGIKKLDALRIAASEIGMALVLCSLTTVVAFYSFIPTDFSGVSELGLIAGTGIIINLILTLTLLPALLRFLPISTTSAHSKEKQGKFDFLLNWPLYYRRSILWGSLILGLGTLLLLPQIRFDYNPLNLRNPHSESVLTLQKLINTEAIPPWSAVALAPDSNTAERLADQFRQLDTVGTVITVQDLIPDQQNKKLNIIDDLALLLGSLLQSQIINTPHPEGYEQYQTTLDQFLHTLNTYLANSAVHPSLSAYQLAADLQQLNDQLKQTDLSVQHQLLLTLQSSLFSTLPTSLTQLQNSLQAEPITLNSLPAELRDRWIASNGVYRVEIFPKKGFDANDTETLRRFVNEIHSITPEATGSLVINLKAGEAIVTSLQKAFTYSLIVIIIILLFLLRSLKDMVLVLIPLLLAGILLGATMVMFNISFNFANVIALPLLLGVGVDSGIYMVHRIRKAPPETGNPLKTSTASALALNTLITAISFGNLIFTSHPGMVSMGLVLAIGIILTLICTLLILPGLLVTNPKRL
ncbi:hopanoid biosynthesis associated RND transporter like protein HpnN [Candidatus Nitrosoglobus terrae]|uniref:Hopanoid biosynthesis associated RND transporter like protein HpnN n=1 Tax=Candidatus Nitrosoglobus terrae TaxID=1630141 RepID=A0A1Q2SN36_9GAMM|nr:MMPL family transporter [Candidatus Nitrosoglobus terrae]BAW80523.1 hopanoid biosynthesis associated RND transporter like protein HpnN [Candidatus Nitrosoglobus terrae]